MFAFLQLKEDPQYKKQLIKPIKDHYGAKIEDYEKTSDPIGLNNSYIKAVIYNTIIEVLVYIYARNLDNFLIGDNSNTDSDDNSEFGKQITSTPDTNLSIATADSDKHQSPINTFLDNKEDLFIPIMSKSKRKHERKRLRR